MFLRPVRALSGLSLGLALAGCGLVPAGYSAHHGSRFSAFGADSTSRYQLFVEPDDTVAPVTQGIQGAKRSIDLVVYILTEPNVISGLIAAHQRGVAVRVLLEQHPYNPSNPNFPLPVNRGAFSQLQAAGVSVKWTDPRFTYTHEKAMVVDNATTYIMTSNLSKSAFANNREYGIVDGVPADVVEVEQVFSADWNKTSYHPQDPDLVISPDNSRERLATLFQGAKHSIVIQDEEMGDPALVSLLGQQVRAGVSVRVQLAKFAPNAQGDTNAQEQRQLNAAGVTQVGFIAKPMLHAKLVVVDGQVAYVGSENLSTNSLDNNREMGVILRDPAIVSKLAKTADQDWANNSGP